MAPTPQITERSEQPYVAIRADVTMEQLSGLADHFGEVFGWLAERGVDNLLRWAEANGLEWDRFAAEDGMHWGCRLESYLTNPAEQPDSSKWETQLAFRLK